MGNGPTERALPGLYGIDMDPLMIAGGIGEAVDLLLIHFDPGAEGHQRSNAVVDVLKTVKESHARNVSTNA
jgi:hypothetical protein